MWAAARLASAWPTTWPRSRAWPPGGCCWFEPEAAKANDRTWRYWAVGPTPFEAIESHRWAQLVVRTPGYEQVFDLAPYRYRLVRAGDFYRHVHTALAACPAQFTRLTGRVTALAEAPDGAGALGHAGRRPAGAGALRLRQPPCLN